jgi:hypothetical protein
MNDKIKITNDFGVKVEAQTPVIISASRSTDIPAFYAKWFINRIKKGHIVWYNPFNQQPLYVSFKNCKVIVFWIDLFSIEFCLKLSSNLILCN